jgi:hypothetical protein
MPKLVIPSTTTKFPPEITVTPPTPTLLSPKGSISEETKQKLKVTMGNGQGYKSQGAWLEGLIMGSLKWGASLLGAWGRDSVYWGAWMRV